MEHLGLYSILGSLPIEDFIPLTVGVLLGRLYLKTKIVDYLIFSSVFILSYLSELTTYLAINYSNVIYFKLSFIFVTLTYIALDLHIHRLKYNQLTLRLIMEIFLGLVLVLIIANWEPMMQSPTTNFFGFEIPRGSSIYYPAGAGITLFDGNLTISTAHADIIYVYWAYINCRATYTYATIDLKIETQETRRVKFLWTLSFLLSFIWTISLISIFFISELTNFLIVGTFMLQIFIAFRYPQAMLLSHIQIKRASELIQRYYDNVDNDVSGDTLQKQIKDNGEFTPVSQIIHDLSIEDAEKLFEKTDIPHAVYILNKTQLIEDFALSERFDNQNQKLIGNLISALLAFSEEILNTRKDSKYFRFQTDEYNLTATKLEKLIVCYIFEGYPPLAEIRLNRFIQRQREHHLEFWKSISNQTILKFDTKEKDWLKNQIYAYLVNLK